MAYVFASQVDLQKIPLKGLVPESATTAPGSPVAGQLWLDTSLTPPRLKVYENGAWVLVSQTGSELLANKGGADGYASLDAAAKVPLAQLPTGQTSTTVALGNDARFTDQRVPTDGSVTGGTAGAGVKIAATTITAANIANATITDTQIAAANKDGVAGTVSLRTLGTGAQQALAGNTRLDQLAVPTAVVSLNSQRITNVADPTGAQDAATKAYVDATRQGLDTKDSVRVATTANITLSGTQTIDGVAVAAGDRVLVKNQTTASENGIYVVAAGAWTRATDADTSADVTAGMFTFVEEGTTNSDSGWVLTTNAPITLGTTGLTFTQFSGAGQITPGNGLTKTGNTLDVGGTTNRITVATDSVDIASTYVGQTSITTLGTITTGTWTGTAVALANGGTGATTAAAARTNLGAIGRYAGNLPALTAGVEVTVLHSLNSTDVVAGFKTVSDSNALLLAWRTIDANNIGVTADLAYAAAAVRVVVMG